jgi:hypothetical protein
MEQARTQFMFKSADLLTDRRLNDVELFRGAGKIPQFSHRQEIPDLANLHGIT